MKAALPLGAGIIGDEWLCEEGGFGVTGQTDHEGRGIIGLYPLGRNGMPAGQATFYAYEHLLIRMVIGFDERFKAVVVHIDVELTDWGMYLRVVVPPSRIGCASGTHSSVRWGSPPPELYHSPANANWSASPEIHEI